MTSPDTTALSAKADVMNKAKYEFEEALKVHKATLPKEKPEAVKFKEKVGTVPFALMTTFGLLFLAGLALLKVGSLILSPQQSITDTISDILIVFVLACFMLTIAAVISAGFQMDKPIERVVNILAMPMLILVVSSVATQMLPTDPVMAGFAFGFLVIPIMMEITVFKRHMRNK